MFVVILSPAERSRSTMPFDFAQGESFFIVDERQRNERKQTDDRPDLKDDRRRDEASLPVSDGGDAEVLDEGRAEPRADDHRDGDPKDHANAEEFAAILFGEQVFEPRYGGNAHGD